MNPLLRQQDGGDKAIPFSYEPAPLNRASRLLPPGKGRVGIRSAPASPIARARACALRLRRFRAAPRPDAPAVRRRWSSGCSRQAASSSMRRQGVAARSGRQAALAAARPARGIVASGRQPW